MDGDFFLRLTDVGREVAEQTYEKHCFFTRLLVEAGVDPKTAEQDACRMEHVISQKVFRSWPNCTRRPTQIQIQPGMGGSFMRKQILLIDDDLPLCWQPRDTLLLTGKPILSYIFENGESDVNVNIMIKAGTENTTGDLPCLAFFITNYPDNSLFGLILYLSLAGVGLWFRLHERPDCYLHNRGKA